MPLPDDIFNQSDYNASTQALTFTTIGGVSTSLSLARTGDWTINTGKNSIQNKPVITDVADIAARDALNAHSRDIAILPDTTKYLYDGVSWVLLYSPRGIGLEIEDWAVGNVDAGRVRRHNNKIWRAPSSTTDEPGTSTSWCEVPLGRIFTNSCGCPTSTCTLAAPRTIDPTTITTYNGVNMAVNVMGTHDGLIKANNSREIYDLDPLTGILTNQQLNVTDYAIRGLVSANGILYYCTGVYIREVGTKTTRISFSTNPNSHVTNNTQLSITEDGKFFIVAGADKTDPARTWIDYWSTTTFRLHASMSVEVTNTDFIKATGCGFWQEDGHAYQPYPETAASGGNPAIPGGVRKFFLNDWTSVDNPATPAVANASGRSIVKWNGKWYGTGIVSLLPTKRVWEFGTEASQIPCEQTALCYTDEYFLDLQSIHVVPSTRAGAGINGSGVIHYCKSNKTIWTLDPVTLVETQVATINSWWPRGIGFIGNQGYYLGDQEVKEFTTNTEVVVDKTLASMDDLRMFTISEDGNHFLFLGSDATTPSLTRFARYTTAGAFVSSVLTTVFDPLTTYTTIQQFDGSIYWLPRNSYVVKRCSYPGLVPQADITMGQATEKTTGSTSPKMIIPGLPQMYAFGDVVDEVTNVNASFFKIAVNASREIFCP